MPKTLAMIKMEKNFIAVLEKKYPRKPYLQYTAFFLLNRIKEEFKELDEAFKTGGASDIAGEIADISNLLDYLFERIQQPF